MPSLHSRWPEPTVEELLAGLMPPPHFGNARFETYIPQEESQAQAVADLQAWVAAMNAPEQRRLFRRKAEEPVVGRYLDGGFGVGKTHLLASVWHAARVPAAFGTFVEYTNLVGALGFQRAVDALSQFRLVCIDEFELDDPGDTVLVSTLCAKLVLNGVRLAATSNTLPDRLGEGRFAAEDFMREIQGLAAHFEVLRIDGEDYRHRGLPERVEGSAEVDVEAVVRATPHATLDRFDELLKHLSHVHPSRYRALVQDVTAVGITHITTLHDQSAALRFVVLVDRLYDRDIPIYAHGVPLNEVFGIDLLRGGYRKKYYRALSRLAALRTDA